MYDIAIIGLGPAGATLARLLDKKFKVAAIDKKTPGPDSFRKPCGGLLATDAQKSLSRFNLTLPVEVLVNPQIFAVRTIDTKEDFTRHYQRFYMNLDRHKFDMWLISMIPTSANMDIYSGSRLVSCTKKSGYYQLVIAGPQGRQTIVAKTVVGADGANSIVRKNLCNSKPPRRKYISIQQWFLEKHQHPFYSCIFDPAITDCYCWSVSKDGFLILGGAFPLKGGRERFELLKKKLKDKEFQLGEVIKTEACLVLRPTGPSDFCCGSGNVFLIGEAAGFISPSSLEGISYAFDSAWILADLLNQQGIDERDGLLKAYRRKTLKIRAKLCLKNIKSPFMYHPILRKVVMKSGLMHIDVINGDGE